jgi:methylmalonyl-CoA/ethylmalonyl-CoA epimerase
MRNFLRIILSAVAVAVLLSFSATQLEQTQMEVQAQPATQHISIDSMSVTLPGSPRPHHVALSVPNFEETLQWYQDKLGFRVTLRRDLSQLSTQQAFLKLNGFRIEIFARQNSTRTQPPPANVPDDLLIQGYKHIAFIVDDLDAVAAELKKRNVEFIWEPMVDDELELKLCFIKDNNGNLIELAQALNT